MINIIFKLFGGKLVFLNFFRIIKLPKYLGKKKHGGLSPGSFMSFLFFIKVKLLNYSWIQN
jgi:hypothetical protein